MFIYNEHDDRVTCRRTHNDVSASASDKAQKGSTYMTTDTAVRQGHVFPYFAELATDAMASTKEPIGFTADKPQIPEGEVEFIYNPWSAPDGRADLHIWLAKPGVYEVDGKFRPNFFEVTSLLKGRCTVEEDGYGTVVMNAGDTYVMRPGWTGRWIVEEYVEKSFVWVYTS